MLTQYHHYTDRTINGAENLLMKIDKSSPKCRAGSREAQTNTLRLLQPHTPLSPPALCEPGCLSQLSDLTGPTGSRRQKQNTKHYVRVTCHDFYTRKGDEIKSVGILFIFLFLEDPCAGQSQVQSTREPSASSAGVISVLAQQILSFLWTKD